MTSLYAALNPFLALGLPLDVSRVRTRHNVFRSDGGHLDLVAAIRAHGSNVEHIPLALLLLLLTELSGGHSTALHVLGGALLVARAAHACGLIRGNSLQVFGSLLNLAVQLGLAGYLLWLRPWG